MLLSIFVISYNHEMFIEQCLKSILSQEVDFEYEIILSDDCSTDNTVSRIKSFLTNHPKSNIVKLHFQKGNIGMNKNFMFAYSQCKGKYIAICEGDDYWIDNSKIQKQVDFLEANPDYSLCFHKVNVLNENEKKYTDLNVSEGISTTTSTEDIMQKNYIHTLSICFRALPNGLPEWFDVVYPCDYPLYVLLSLEGKIYMMEDKMAVYRIHDGGIHSTKSQNYRVVKFMSVYKYVGCEMLKRGELKFGDIFVKRYAFLFGFKLGFFIPNSRWDRFNFVIKHGTPLMKMLAWIPLIGGHRSYSLYKLFDKKQY
jgi:glycosyltransferase involved in cell wall biosynthesis